MTANMTKILFIGTSDFGIPLLDAVRKLNNVTIIGCLTALDRKAGRNQEITAPPVKIWAKANRVAVLQPEDIQSPATISELKERAPDLILVASYGQILPKEILELPRLGAVNIHPSLLPRWRGASPIQYTLLAGDKETGVTLIQMDERLDHGPILAQQKIMLKGKESFRELYAVLQATARDLVIKTLPLLQEQKITPIAQNEEETAYAKILKREEGRLNWSQSAEELERQIRAFHVWPESFTVWQKIASDLVKLKITKASVWTADGSSQKKYPYGQVILTPEKHLLVQTGNGFLVLERLTPEGKNEMSGEEFVNGYPSIIGSTLV